jgi:hypothetical protein ngonDG_04816
LYAFAAYLCAFNDGIATTLDKGLAAFFSYVAMAVGYAIAIAVAFADIAACGKA